MDSCGTAFKGVSQTGEASIVARLWAAEAARSSGGRGRGTRREGDVGGESLTTGPRHHSPSAWRPLSGRGRWSTGPGQARQDSEKLPQLESSSREDDEAAAQDSGFRGRLVSEKGEKRHEDGGWGGEGVPFTTRWNTRGEAGLREGKGVFGRGRVRTDRPACGRPGEWPVVCMDFPRSRSKSLSYWWSWPVWDVFLKQWITPPNFLYGICFF